MNPSHIFVFLVLLAGLSCLAHSSFSASDYLYRNETGAKITTDDFSLGGTQYSIVKINGQESFLLAGGEPVKSQEAITQVIRDYYRNAYFPSDSEVQNLKSLLLAYNASRNNGERLTYLGKEEYSCREALFVDGSRSMFMGGKMTPVICRPDLNLCNYSAMLFFQYLTMASDGNPPVSSWTDLLAPVRDFGFASYSIDAIVINATARLSSMGDSDVYNTILYVKNSIPALRANESVLESTKFGWKWSVNSNSWVTDMNHWGLCLPISINGSILDELDLDSSTILAKVAPFTNYDGVAVRIHDSTIDRMENYASETNASYYSSFYLPLGAKAVPVMASGDYTLSHVRDSSLQSDLSALKALDEKINESINDRAFSTIDDDLAQYSALIPKVRNESADVYAVYNQSAAAKSNADTLVFVLDGKDLDPISRAEADRLKNQTNALDDSFSDGLAQQDYSALGDSYQNVSSQAEILLRGTRENPGSMMMLSFRSFARKVNEGLATFISSSKLMPLDEVPDSKMQAFGGFSLITLFSFGAMCVLAFLAILVLRQPGRSSSRYVLTAVFLISLVSVTAFAAFLFVYLDRTSGSADVGEFLADLGGKNSTSILLDLRVAPDTEKGAIQSCGGSIASAISAMNKTVIVYAVDSLSCTMNTLNGDANTTSSLTDGECLSALDNASSVIVLNYSATYEKPKFSVIYTSRADIAADSSYYKACPFAGLISETG